MPSSSEKEDLTVLLVTQKSSGEDLTHTQDRLVKECKKNGFKYFLVSTNEMFVSNEENKDGNIKLFSYKDKQKTVEFVPENTIAIIRGGDIANSQGASSLISFLQDKGCFVINSLECIQICANKFLTGTKLSSKPNLSTPRTSLVSDESAVESAHKNIGGKFPVVIKTLEGAQGIGVSIVNTRESLVSVLQSLWKFGAEVLIQEYLKTEFDVRSIVLDGKVIGSMKRNKIQGDFRSNYSLGSKIESYRLSKEEEEAVLEAAKSVKGYYVGVDHIINKGKPYIIEVNSSPGSKGIEEATGLNLIGELIKHVSDKKNWKSNFIEVGYIEYIDIEGVGKLKSKLDTGNGALNVLHASEIVHNPNTNKVSFVYDGKKYTKDFVSMKKVHVDNSISRHRHVVLFDIVFGGMTYKDVPFSLDDRSNRSTPVLLSRQFIKDHNFMVNPSKKYVFGAPMTENFKDYYYQNRDTE